MKKTSLVLLAKTDKTEATANKFVCKDTKKILFTNVASEALSPFSGNSFLSKSSKTTQIDTEAFKDLKEVASCPTCETTWLASAAFVEAHENFHCVVCNEELKTTEATQEIVQAEEADILINDNETPKETLEEEVKEINEETFPEAGEEIKDEGAEVKADILDETPSTLVIEINNPESVVVAPEEITPEELPEELSEEVPEALLEDSVEGIETPEEVFEANLSYNLAHLLTKAEYADKVELVASTLNKETPSFYLMVNSIPVAVAEFAQASEVVKSMFSDSELVLKSLQVTLSNSTNEEGSLALKDFGIRPIVVPVISEKAAVASNVAKIARELTASFKKKEAEMFNIWRESFSTAALLYCKNLQKKSSTGKQKSLITKASLIETIKAVGINNADVIVEEAFKRGIQRDYSVIVEEALSLYSKTPEARKEVRDFVSDADYQSSVSLASDQAPVSEAVEAEGNVTHYKTISSHSEDIGSIMASLKNAVHSRAI